jgi:hypothetical protein
MKSKMLIVTDLGTFKAFRVDENQFNSTPRLELIKSFDVAEAHTRLSDRVSDQAGQFPRGTGAPAANSDMSNGERHNMELEHRRRLVKHIAEAIQEVAKQENPDLIYFAAGHEINQQILNELAPPVKNKIAKTVSSNLTKTDKSDLLGYFD